MTKKNSVKKLSKIYSSTSSINNSQHLAATIRFAKSDYLDEKNKQYPILVNKPEGELSSRFHKMPLRSKIKSTKSSVPQSAEGV